MFGFHRWTVSIRSSRQPCTLRLASVSTARPPSCCQRSIQSSESNMQIVSAKGARSGTSLLLPGVALWCPHIGGVARLLAVLLLGTTWLAIARMDVCARACVCVRMRAYACVCVCALMRKAVRALMRMAVRCVVCCTVQAEQHPRHPGVQ